MQDWKIAHFSLLIYNMLQEKVLTERVHNMLIKNGQIELSSE